MTDLTPPAYPAYTGYEPCATTDPEIFYPEKGKPGRVSSKRIREICDRCPMSMFVKCREWAVWFEDEGYWAGMSPSQRERERAARGIDEYLLKHPESRRQAA